MLKMRLHELRKVLGDNGTSLHIRRRGVRRAMVARSWMAAAVAIPVYILLRRVGDVIHWIGDGL